MNKKSQKIILISLFLGLIVFGVYQNTFKSNKLEKKGKIVRAEIIDFEFVYKTTYKITYKFIISEKTYKSSRRTSYFKCENGREGCVGKIFKVKYLPNNPEINEIYLEDYDRFKKHKPIL